MRQPAFNHCIVTDLPATLSLDNGQLVDGTAFNLSRSGVLVRIQTPCPSARSGTLTLKTGSNRHLRVSSDRGSSGQPAGGLDARCAG